MAIFLFVSFILITILFIKQNQLEKLIREQKLMILTLLSKQKEMEKKTGEKETLVNVPEAAPPVMTAPGVNVPGAAPVMTAPGVNVPGAAPVMTAPRVNAPGTAPPVMTAPGAAPPVMTAPGVYAPGAAPPAMANTRGRAPKAPPVMTAPRVLDKKASATPAKEKGRQLFSNEDWVGISLFNRLGALLIVIGTIAIAAFEGFHPILRTTILFALAFGVITLGEFMNRKKPTIVSTGFSATGVALTYVAIAASFFGLETLGMYAALIACIIATVIGIFLATRYNAQVIGCFALVGGYLPIFALDPFNNTMMVGVMVYFIMLSLFSLSLALTRKWSVMNIIGFALTVIGASYLGWQADPLAALIYACFAFLLYTALPLIAGFRTKEKFSNLDIWLIILNTFISTVVIFLIANRLDVQNLHALLCLAFAIIYACVAFLVKRVFNQESLPTIFTITSIAFCVIFVPFYFAIRWFPIAWLVLAVVLASFGILQRRKIAEYSGLIILGISTVALLAVHFTQEVERVVSYLFLYEMGVNIIETWQFTYDYSVFTFGTLVILGCYFVKNRQWRGSELVYKIAAFANLWIFALYVIFRHVPGAFYDSVIEHLVLTSWVIVTFALAYLYCKIPLWADVATRVLANVIHFAGILGLWAFSLAIGKIQDYSDNIRLMINLFMMTIGFILVILYHLTEKRNGWTVAYKNINITSIWLAFLWCYSILISNFFGVQLILITFTFVTAFTITRIQAIADRGTYGIAIAMHIIGLLWLWVFNLTPYDNVLGSMIFNAVVLIIALVALNDLFNLCNVKGSPKSLKIVILSAYFLLVVTQLMMVQGNVSFNSAVISIMYALAAFAWIIVGFRLKSKPIRQAGLFLSMAAVAKLLVVDTWGLSIEMRIISYISLGLLLMLISFIYQKLSKKVEEKAG